MLQRYETGERRLPGPYVDRGDARCVMGLCAAYLHALMVREAA